LPEAMKRNTAKIKRLDAAAMGFMRITLSSRRGSGSSETDEAWHLQITVLPDDCSSVDRDAGAFP